jgi:5-methylthioadenosine/S-adenosylhomocysteine deaminase
VALGADGPPCNNRLSVFAEMTLAGTLHNLRHGPTAVDPWTVLALATRCGAAAVHLGDEVGTLEAGKAADVVVIDASDWSFLPDGDPASRIVYGATAAAVRHVLVAGRPLVAAGELVPELGPDAIRARCGPAWSAVRARMEQLS